VSDTQRDVFRIGATWTTG